MADEIIRVEDIWVRYDGVTVLEEVNLSIEEGDFIGIIGPNGGGKTTLLKVILGLIKPNRGQVTVLGKPQGGKTDIGYVPQHALFDPRFPISVWDVVLMGRYGYKGLFHWYSAQDKEITSETLQMVDMLHYKDRQIGQLSGGEQQRVFIARALVGKPKVLLLDEPMTSIDPAMQGEFYELLERLRKDIAIVLVSHDVGAVSVYVEKVACLNRRLFYHGTAELTADILEKTYQCPIQLITHGVVPHRVLGGH